MRIVPVVNIGPYLFGRLIGHVLRFVLTLYLPFMIVVGIVMTIVELVKKAIAAFLASAFYANLVATWNAIVAFFEAYGWIFELVFAFIGFITTIVLIVRGIKIAREWISDFFYDIKCKIRRNKEIKKEMSDLFMTSSAKLEERK